MINHLGIADITPEGVQGIMQYNFDPAAVSVASDSEYETLEEFVDAMESQDALRVGTSGTGSIWHIAAAGMAQEVGGQITNVPFDGAAPAIQAVLGGQIEATTASGAEIASQVESDQLRPLATMGEERVDILPDTPTLKEKGIDWTSGAWRGLVVPSDTPDERVQALNDCFKQAYDSSSFQEFMENNGFGTVYKPAGEFEEFMTQEYQRYGDIIESLNITQ
jgi:tripartite-type tricarboxylate transporter receptor subunit TctC